VQLLQPVRFKGALPAGHVKQSNASLMFEKPLLLQFAQMLLIFEARWMM
jgi:hypothetical protein